MSANESIEATDDRYRETSSWAVSLCTEGTRFAVHVDEGSETNRTERSPMRADNRLAPSVSVQSGRKIGVETIFATKTEHRLAILLLRGARARPQLSI